MITEVGGIRLCATDDLGQLAHPLFCESTKESLGLLIPTVFTEKKKGKPGPVSIRGEGLGGK